MYRYYMIITHVYKITSENKVETWNKIFLPAKRSFVCYIEFLKINEIRTFN